MGTRADFYSGRGKTAEWLGSIAWDGTEIPDEILYAHDDAMYRREVAAFLASRGDGTVPSDGWPWPWDDSRLTDCSYWFFDGQCWDARKEWKPVGYVFAQFDKHRPKWDGEEDESQFYTRWLTGKPVVEYPDMSDKRHAALGARSGVIVVVG